MAVFKAAPNPNAARLMFAWIMSAEGQEFIVNLSGQYPANQQVKAKAGRPPLSSIKTMREDPAEVEKHGRRDQGEVCADLQGMKALGLRHREAARCRIALHR